MPHHREWQRQFEEQPPDDEHHHRSESENQILTDDRRRPTCQVMCRRKLFHVFGKERDIRSLKSHLRSRCAHRDADVGPSKCRRVINPVSDESDLTVRREVANHADLFIGQHICMYVAGLKPELHADAQSNGPAIPCHHDDLPHAAGPQRGKGRSGRRARLVGNADSSQDVRIPPKIDDSLCAIG